MDKLLEWAQDRDAWENLWSSDLRLLVHCKLSCANFQNALKAQFFIYISVVLMCVDILYFLLGLSYDRTVMHLHIKWGVAVGPTVMGAGTRHLPPSSSSSSSSSTKRMQASTASVSET